MMAPGKRSTAWMLGFCVAGALAGCGSVDFLSGFLFPRRVEVALINNSDFPVDVELYYSDDQNVLESVLQELGTKVERTVGPGEISRFNRDCDDLQAIFIRDADLLVVGGFGPDDDTEVLRDGTDFGCGDSISFTFDHGPAVLDFRISVNVSD